MTDLLTPERRSWNMSRIRSANTRPELIATQLFRRMGYSVECHRCDLPGKPDIVLPHKRTAVFIHGCFWHRHADCRMAYSPKSNRAFWNLKFSGNVKRDRTVRRKLRQLGWRSIVIWECQLRNLPLLKTRIRARLKKAPTPIPRKPLEVKYK